MNQHDCRTTATNHHRLPRSGVDIIDAESACALIAATVAIPPRHETIMILLDDTHRGLGVVVVTNTERPSAVIDVVELFVQSNTHHGRVAAAIVASVRPTISNRDHPDETPIPPIDVPSVDDFDRWYEMSDLAQQSGVELLEWFVIGSEVSCPRERCGEPPRW